MTILGSSLLGLTISIIEYFDQRRKTLETFMLELNKYSIAVKNIRPMNIKEPLNLVKEALHEERSNQINNMFNLEQEFKAKNELISHFEDSGYIVVNSPEEHDEHCENGYINSMKHYREELYKAKKSIMDISKFDLSIMSKTYAEIEFLLKNKKLRSWIYNDIYEKIANLNNEFIELTFHLGILDESKNPNLAVNLDKVDCIYKKIFRCEETTIESMQVTQVFNDFGFELDKSWEKLKSLTYFRKENTITNEPVLGKVERKLF
jgi:hypothetical protein